MKVAAPITDSPPRSMRLD